MDSKPGSSLAEVDSLVDSWQEVLGKARTDFGDGWETRIVVAAVVENAQAARRHLVTSVPGGDRLTSRVDGFLDEAEKADVVGRLMGQARRVAGAAGQTLIKEVFFSAVGVSAPATILSAIGAILTIAGVIQDLGEALGAGLAFIALGFLALAGRYGYVFVRALQLAASALQQARSGLNVFGSGFFAAVASVNALGTGAERLLAGSMRQRATSFFGSSGALPGFEVPRRVRGTAQGIFYSAAVIVLVSAVIFMFGLAEGFSETIEDAPCPSYRGQVCPVEIPELNLSFLATWVTGGTWGSSMSTSVASGRFSASG